MSAVDGPDPARSGFLLKEEEEEAAKVNHGPNARLLKFFKYDHLKPEVLRDQSKLFHDLAHIIDQNTPPGPETTVALRKLLEAKDAAVRALL